MNSSKHTIVGDSRICIRLYGCFVSTDECCTTLLLMLKLLSNCYLGATFKMVTDPPEVRSPKTVSYLPVIEGANRLPGSCVSGQLDSHTAPQFCNTQHNIPLCARTASQGAAPQKGTSKRRSSVQIRGLLIHWDLSANCVLTRTIHLTVCPRSDASSPQGGHPQHTHRMLLTNSNVMK